jgi:hypothetical protein
MKTTLIDLKYFVLIELKYFVFMWIGLRSWSPPFLLRVIVNGEDKFHTKFGLDDPYLFERNPTNKDMRL